MMANPKTLSVLQEIFREETAEFGLNIKAETMFIDVPGWDSVTMSSVILSAEDKFGVRFKAGSLDHLQCVGDLADMIEGMA